MKTYNINIEMYTVEPTEHHKGWVDFFFTAPTSDLSHIELTALSKVLSEDQLVGVDPRFKGFSHNGGIYDYDPEFGRSVFKIEVSEDQVNQAIQCAKELGEHDNG